MIFQQTFTIDTDGKVADDDNINIIPCSLSSSSNKNDYCPTPLEGDEAERARQKIRKIQRKGSKPFPLVFFIYSQMLLNFKAYNCICLLAFLIFHRHSLSCFTPDYINVINYRHIENIL